MGVLEKDGRINKIIFEDISDAVLLSQLIKDNEYSEQTKDKQFNAKRVSKLFVQVFKAICEIEERLMPLQRILPENILVKNHDSDNPEVRIIVAGLTIGDLN